MTPELVSQHIASDVLQVEAAKGNLQGPRALLVRLSRGEEEQEEQEQEGEEDNLKDGDVDGVIVLPNCRLLPKYPRNQLLFLSGLFHLHFNYR